MRVTFQQLCDVVHKHRDGIVARIRPRPDNTELVRKYLHPSSKRDIVLQALYNYVVAHGAIQIRGVSIGVSPSSRGFSGLAATDTVKLRELVAELRTEAMRGFGKQLTARWEELQRDNGLIARRKGGSDAEKFAGDRFEGFR